MTPCSATLAHLYALRAHLDAVIMAAEVAEGVTQTQPVGCPKCGTPEDQLQNTSTFNVKRRRCPNCGNEWEL